MPNTSPATSSNNGNPYPDGIDIQTALSILSERTTQMDVRDESSKDHNGVGGGGCGCCHHQRNNGGGNASEATSGGEIPDTMKRMGQVIDLNNDNSSSDSGSSSLLLLSEEEMKKQREEQEKIKSERAKRQQEIHNELQSMSNKDLLQAVLNVQEERVATYKTYESGLMVVLESGNMTSYPNICSQVTASFAVLSETIKEIQSILKQQRNRNDLVSMIQQLQNLEKEKLQLTAANHLERIRERNQQQQILAVSAGGEEEGLLSGELRIQKLLKDGIESLQQKINNTIESINDVIDDIRCSLLEEEDNE